MSVGSSPPAGAAPLGAALVAFAQDAVAAVLRGHTAYFYDEVRKTEGDLTLDVAGTPPDIHLEASPPTAYVDCSAWMNFALSAVAPDQAAALNAARNDPRFNPVSGYVAAYNPEGRHEPVRVPMQESMQPWARANVAAYFFAQVAAPANGFCRVSAIPDLQAGDLLAWSLGIYADPANPDAAHDPSLVATGDTGHVVIVAGPASRYGPPSESAPHWPEGFGLGRDPQSKDCLAVYAVPVIDASSVRHADDSRTYTVPPAEAPPLAKAGGLGRGTLFFSVDASGAPLQFCFNDGSPTEPADWFVPPGKAGSPTKVVIAAARLV